MRRSLPAAVIITHPRYLDHRQSAGHVEAPHRLEAILRKLDALHLADETRKPVPVTGADLERVHRRDYLEFLQNAGEGLIDPDTRMGRETWEIAQLAAGGALAAAWSSLEAGRPSFALVRPPGHHAGPDHGGGFCYLNNVAIAAAALLEKLRRVAILDVDVHHGNGTQEVFAGDSRVLYLSAHEWGIYPGTGPAEDVGGGNIVNVPLPARSGDTTYEYAWDALLLPVLSAFRPEALLVSFGVDAHAKDPLASLTLSSVGYVELAQDAIDFARKTCNGRAAFVLEGGYHPSALAETVAGVVAAFRGEEVHLQYTEVEDDTCRGREAVTRAIQVHKERWPL